eukprot:TRINITY_DN161400_c0_g1_i3.p1 TRINITY_DN161400_c0_g1~~TRINITY_DN161400_c0_g1_i3.p1  ORF type:complete len:483 (+),score=185.89 TRINITY_DN161400_c0_g1_i3:245-1693(+)
MGDWDLAMRKLSMGEGLGPKYGAPRRDALQRMRTAITRSTQSEERITEVLNKIENTTASPNADVSSTLRELITDARDRIATRALYLEAWKTDISVQLPKIDCQMDPSNENFAVYEVKDDDEQSIDTTTTLPFIKSLEEAAEDCRDATKKLFSDEGVELENGEVPQALQTFLAEMMEKCSEQRFEWAKRLREQLRRLHELCASVPVVVCSSILNDHKELLNEERDICDKNLDNHSENARIERDENQRRARPELALPSYKNAFEELKQRENERQGICDEKLEALKENCVKNFDNVSKRFHERLLHSVAQTMHLFDSFPMETYFAPLPGDELLQPKKKNLKQLRRELEQREKLSEEERNKRLRNACSPIPLEPLTFTSVLKTLEAKKTEDITSEENSSDEAKSPSSETEDDTPTMTPELTGYWEVPQRRLGNQRHIMFGNFKSFFEDYVEQIQRLFEKEGNAESRWKSEWSALMEDLQVDSESHM